MKTNFRFGLAGVCGALTFAAWGQNAPAVPETPALSQVEPPRSSGSGKTDVPAKVEVPPPRYPAHPPPSPSGRKNLVHAPINPEVTIATPPPPPRAEEKPAAPGANYVWVPGHYAPAKGQWRWIPGEWSVPATPTSVWIEARYDADAKRWSPGYWQPDRPSDPDPAAKDSAAPRPGSY